LSSLCAIQGFHRKAAETQRTIFNHGKHGTHGIVNHQRERFVIIFHKFPEYMWNLGKIPSPKLSSASPRLCGENLAFLCVLCDEKKYCGSA